MKRAHSKHGNKTRGGYDYSLIIFVCSLKPLPVNLDVESHTLVIFKSCNADDTEVAIKAEALSRGTPGSGVFLRSNALKC